jgi:6-pyruvoyltetrahydropterin/6-carboxytetrahydropterin synthase
VSRLAIIEIDKSELKFSAGHFMIYDATEREHMHGHDYQISAAFNTRIISNGMSVDIRLFKQRLLTICKMLDYHFLLQGQSEFLRIEDQGDKWVCRTGRSEMVFLKEDAIVLPICNLTLEELSNWLVQQLIENPAEIAEFGIVGMTIKVHNGRGESGGTTWGQMS